MNINLSVCVCVKEGPAPYIYIHMCVYICVLTPRAGDGRHGPLLVLEALVDQIKHLQEEKL